MSAIHRHIDAPDKEDDLRILRPSKLGADGGLGWIPFASESSGLESAVQRRFRNSLEPRGIEPILRNGLTGRASDVRRVTRDESLADPRRYPPGEGHSVIVANLVRRIMDVRDANRRQRAIAHQEMPTADVVLVIVNCVISAIEQ